MLVVAGVAYSLGTGSHCYECRPSFAKEFKYSQGNGRIVYVAASVHMSAENAARVIGRIDYTNTIDVYSLLRQVLITYNSNVHCYL